MKPTSHAARARLSDRFWIEHDRRAAEEAADDADMDLRLLAAVLLLASGGALLAWSLLS